MSEWKEIIARRLQAVRLDSTRSKILALAVLATLIPAVATTCVSYGQNRRLLTEQITQELRSASSDAARELDLWLDERLGELRASVSSYVVSENLTKVQGRDGAQAASRLREYLGSVRGRFPDQEALLVIDPRGRVVASTGGRGGSVRIPLDRLNGLRTADAFVGEAYWDAALGKAALLLAVPIRQADGLFLGAFTAKISLTSVAELLQRLAPDQPRDVYVMTDQGRMVITSRTSSAELMRTRLPEATTSDLFDKEGQTVEYRRADGQEVVAVVRRVPGLRWATVVELQRAEASRRVGRLRTRTALMIAVLLAGIGVLAYVAGLAIASPLERLTAAAAKVAAGDLSVEVPAGGSGEVGYLARAFSHLVTRLRERESQGELERLSVTDALTGLYNRRHLVGTLANEVQRSRRLRRTFSVLMADVDHFKQYNDTRGHLAGDAALVKIAEILRRTTRGVDSVARYGGEEFLVMLLEAPLAVAASVGERVRARVATEEFEGGTITVSIGVAEYPTHGDTPEELIASADAAMYQAKAGGRNRVVLAGGLREREKEEEKEKKRRRKGDT